LSSLILHDIYTKLLTFLLLIINKTLTYLKYIKNIITIVIQSKLDKEKMKIYEEENNKLDDLLNELDNQRKLIITLNENKTKLEKDELKKLCEKILIDNKKIDYQKIEKCYTTFKILEFKKKK
jgi:hypothetical protein